MTVRAEAVEGAVRPLRLPIAAALAVAVSVLAWRSSGAPVVWIAGAWACVAFMSAAFGRRRWWRLVWVNVTFALGLVAIADLLLSPAAHRGDPAARRIESSHDVIVRHPTLGFAPYGPTARHVRLTAGGREIYDVVYTFDGYGRRVTPDAVIEPPVGTFVAFGGSFTFGEGVADRESLPWRVAERCGRRWKAVNFGFQGWGAQQMLAALEAGLVSDALAGERLVVLYQCAFFHVERTAGRVRWAAGTPRYVIAGPVLRREGSYPDELGGPFPWPHPFDRWLLWRRLMGDVRPPPRPAIELFARVVDAARDQVLRVDPKARFEILYWDLEPPWLDGPVLRALRAERLSITRSSDVVPTGPEWRLDAVDAHPSAAAHDVVARWVVEDLLAE